MSIPRAAVSPDLLAILARCDTGTVCNAIEVVEGGRGFMRFTRFTPLASDPSPFFGRARTASIAGRERPAEAADTLRRRRMDYYRHMAEGPSPECPALVVVQDLDADQDGRGGVGAFWGGINTAIHKGFGLTGALTNGVMRDLDDMEPGFPVIAGSIGPSHGWVHVREIGRVVEVLGLKIADGDFVHADRHGAVVVPEAVLPDLKAGIETLWATERIILEAARADGFDFARFETAWETFEKARV